MVFLVVSFSLEPKDHLHSEECGHARVPHGDHFDYLVDNVLHHVLDDGRCIKHGSVKLMFRNGKNKVRKSSTSSSATDDSLVRGHAASSTINRRYDYYAATLEKQSITKKAIKKHDGKKNCRFFTMFSLTLSFFFVELVAGYLVGSLALQADAYHMASDVLALAVGWYSANASNKKGDSVATYGWRRFVSSI